MTITLVPKPLTSERFAPFGDVIESVVDRTAAMNAERFERFDDLCRLDMSDNGRIAVSIARCRIATALVVVAPPEESVEAADLCAFVTNGRQGINYHRGTWHMPLIAFESGQEFLIIDRAADQPNCDMHSLDEPVMLVEG
jgi:ureidoglycolate lyase